ncbi:GNAT family N-acetyltransferase [Niveispirillum sp. KHB5.9]|uniref:GNAT family N-acetyltransferase n=1 Tax=Niveispirillum sp. KHB5.9 TaxID=3400269 RepID=UPI003A88F3C9
MTAPDVRISIEYGVPVTGPDADIVLGGLMAYNAAALPAVTGRFSIVASDQESADLRAGLSISQWGRDAYCFWGIWVVPGVEPGPAIAAVLARTEAELVRRDADRLIMVVRSHDDTAPYLAAGYGVRQVIGPHIRGGNFTVLEKRLARGAEPAAPGLALAVHEPAPKRLAKEIWRITDARRQGLLAAPVKLVAAYVRDVSAGTPRGAALCYAVENDFMVDMVWLDDSLRGTGTGFAMLAAALDEGRKLGCTRAAVETMDCQAPTFYPQHGFRRFGYAEYDVPGLNMNFYDMKL